MSHQPSPNVRRRNDGNLVLRVYRDNASDPVEYVMDPSEALGLAIDLTNKARISIEHEATVRAKEAL